MLTIGLTGGIGSGKTTVSDIFASLGVPIIDSDLIAHNVVQPGEPGLEGIIQHFGEKLLQPDGSLDRQQLRNLVFDDETARRQLEQILHPLIRQRSQQQLESLNTPYAILAIPLLVETGLADSVDRVLVVDCPETVQVERICRRDGIDPDQAKAILAAQCSRKQRLDAAHDIIDNNQPLAGLTQKINSLHKQYLALSATT